MAQIAYTSVLFSGVTSDVKVAVIGLGLVGNIALQLFAKEGSQVYGIDPSSQRRSLAPQVTNATTISPADLTTVERFGDIVVEASGATGAVSAALSIAAKKGKVILLGSTRGSVNLDVYSLIYRTGITLQGAHEFFIPWFSDSQAQVSRSDITQKMLAKIFEEKILVDPLISDIVSPQSLHTIYKTLSSHEWQGLTFLIDLKRCS